MKPLQAGMKITKILGKPVQIFFGSDEKGFITLTSASIITYFSGFPDAATIMAVYSTIFAYSTMQEMKNTSNSSQDSGVDEEEIMSHMGEAMDTLQEVQEKDEVEK